MIVYSSTKQGFLEDAASGIEDVIRDAVQENLHINIKVGSSPYNAWKNSLGNAMFHVMNCDQIPDDAGVAVEYSIPRTKNCIDFIVTGADENGEEKVIIIELKQWTNVEVTDMDAMVSTRYGRGIQEVIHPSYQAWTYASLLRGFNAVVYKEKIDLSPCAYLHNHQDANTITNAFYADYLDKAPVFCKGDKEKLQDFIAQFVKFGDKQKTIYKIEAGEIRPSKELAEKLASMMKGNQEFIMIDDQKIVYENALAAIRKSSPEKKHVLIVEGGPGTGKSVVGVNILVETTKKGLNSMFVTKNEALRSVFKAKLTGSFKNSEISNLFSGSGSFIGQENTFDTLIVDEAHRLSEKSGYFKNLGENQIKELIKAAKSAIFFVDDDQKVTWQDIGSKEQIDSWATQLGASVQHLKLESQFRCNGSDGFIAWLDNVLQVKETANMTLADAEYNFQVVDSPHELRSTMHAKNNNNKARLVAGYCWNWVSKRRPNLYDISIPEHNFEMRWNLAKDKGLYIISPASIEEAGCIHTCQGLELEYVGVIIGPDLIVRNGKVICDPSKRAKTDSSLKGYKKALKENPEAADKKAEAIIKNTYRTLMTRGLKGCYVYCVDKETEEYFKEMASL